MIEEKNIEAIFLAANKAIDNNDMAEAKDLLEEIIIAEPGFGRAHNHLGWIYNTKFKNFEKAKIHYDLAVKFCKKTYPVVYVNYTYLLIDFDYLDQALNIIDEGLKINGSDKASLYFQKGRIYENKKQYRKSIKYHKEARENSYNNDFITFIENEIARIKRKNIFLKLFF